MQLSPLESASSLYCASPEPHAGLFKLSLPRSLDILVPGSLCVAKQGGNYSRPPANRYESAENRVRFMMIMHCAFLGSSEFNIQLNEHVVDNYMCNLSFKPIEEQGLCELYSRSTV